MSSAAKCVMRVIFKDCHQGPADAARAAFIVLMADYLEPPDRETVMVAAALSEPELYVFDPATAKAVAKMLEVSGAPYEFGDPAGIPPLDVEKTKAAIKAASQEIELPAQSEYEAALHPSMN